MKVSARPCRSRGLDGPELASLDQRADKDFVPVTDVAREVILLDHLAHVGENLGCGSDRWARQGLKR